MCERETRPFREEMIVVSVVQIRLVSGERLAKERERGVESLVKGGGGEISLGDKPHRIERVSS